MKKIIVLAALIICVSNALLAGTEEMRLRVLDYYGNFINGVPVYLYEWSDFSSGRLTPIRSGVTAVYDAACNFKCDVGDDATPTSNPSWARIDNGDYVLRIATKCIQLSIDQPPVGSAGDFMIVFRDSSFTVIDNNRGIGYGSTQNWPANLDVTFSASYGSGGSGLVDGETVSLPHTENFKKETQHTFTAINNQTINGHLATFRAWEAQQSNNLALTVSIDQTSQYTAVFGIRYTLNFTNSFPETVGASSIMVDDVVQTGSTIPVNVYSDQSVRVAALAQTINSVNMNFDHWSDGQSAGSATRAFVNPQADANYTIYYRGTPTAVPNWASTCNLWEPISMSWTEYPNTNVTQYQVWRRIGSDPASLLQTLNRGTTSFIDYEYLLTPPRVLIVNYDIRPFYSPSGTTSEPVWHSFFTNPFYKKVLDRKTPTDYRVGNYPNPFNPSTTITYQIVDDAEITINICDLTGRIVKSVLNEHKPAGYYAASWDGKTESGQAAASGVYFFLFKARPVNGNAMVVRTGKLLLTK